MILKGRIWPLRLRYMKTKTALFHQKAPAGTKKIAPIIGLGVLAGCSFWYMNSYNTIWSEPPKYLERQSHDSRVEGVLWSLANEKSRVAVKDKSTFDLMISYAVYKACSLRWLIEVAPNIFSYASSLHLTQPLNFILRHTIYKQFLGGESMKQCKATMDRLKSGGIGVILALSVETDVEKQDEEGKDKLRELCNHKADETTQITKQCILSASTQPGSFVAVKVSALTSPLLLQTVTRSLSQLYGSFEEHASAQTMSQNQVCHVVAQHRGQVNVDENVLEIVHSSSYNEIDMVEFKHMLLLDRPVVLNLFSNVLSSQDKQDWWQMLSRLDEICSLAKSCGVKILIDAEQTYLQLAIDQAALVMEQRHNKLGACPTVYNTCMVAQIVRCCNAV
jgi:proline dehydrogenase